MGRKFGYISFLKKRFRRILIPYWFYAGICICVTFIYEICQHNLNRKLVSSVFFTWMLPIGHWIEPLPYLSWALWFIPVYLGVMVIFPMMQQCYFSKYRYMGGIILILLYFVTLCFPYERIRSFGIRQVAFYAIWTYLGLFYRDITLLVQTDKRWPRKMGICVIVGIFMIVVLSRRGYSLDMQTNKSSQNIMFFAFAFTAMSAFLMGMPILRKVLHKISEEYVLGKIYKIFMERSMTVYLYQSFIFLIVTSAWNSLVPLLFRNSGAWLRLVQIIVYYSLVLIGTAMIAVILGRIEEKTV